MCTGQQNPTQSTGYPVKTGLELACIQVIVGLLSIIFETIFQVLYPQYMFYSYPFSGTGYCGVLYVIAGVVGIAASKTAGRRSLVTATMVLSICAAALAIGYHGTSGMLTLWITDSRQPDKAAMVKNYVPFFLAFVEGVTAIVQCAMCCSGRCCSSRPGQEPIHYTTYPVKKGLVLGYMQLALGILSVALQAIVIALDHGDRGNAWFGFTGFSCGMVYLIAGSLAVGASKTGGKRGLVMGTMVVSIVAAICAFLGQIFASTPGLIDWQYTDNIKLGRIIGRVASSVVMIALAFVEFVTAIIQSTMCCRGCCCSQPAGQPVCYVIPTQQLLPEGHMGDKMWLSTPAALVQLPEGETVLIINSPAGEHKEAAVPPLYQEKPGE